ncbi:MAG: RnfABCDGE type electron transport complex subunit G [Thermoplasmata archaeon]
MKKEDFMTDIFPILFLTIVVCISVVGLSLTNSVTEERIKEAKEEAIREMLSEQFPEMQNYEYNDDYEFYTIYGEDEVVIGYAYRTEGSGYGGAIEMLVALEDTGLTTNNTVIRGISIISHQETPGLGAKIEQESFLDQFEGVNANDVSLAENGGEIDAISGATISSSAVVDEVHQSALEKAEQIRESQEAD